MTGPTGSRPRRWPWIVAALSATALATWLWGIPALLAAIMADAVEAEWGDRVTVDRASWNLGRRITLHGLDVYDEATGRPFATCTRAIAELERSPAGGDPGLLLDLVLEGCTLVGGDDTLATVHRVHYHREGDAPARLAFDGVHAALVPSEIDRWIGAVTRIVSAPGIAPDGGGPLMRAIDVRRTRIEVSFAGTEVRVPVGQLSARIRPTAAKALAIEFVRARAFDGDLTASGDVDWSGRLDYRVQAHLRGIDVNAVGTALGLGAASRGHASAFLALRAPHDPQHGGNPVGSGWVAGTDVRVWDAPLFAAILGTLGLEGTDDDTLEHVDGKVRFDHGRLWLVELIAQGQPVSLFCNGSLALADGALDLGVVPRVAGGRGVSDLPLVGEPTQAILDVVAGTAIQLRIAGRIGEPDVAVQPLSIITEPMRAFFALIRGERSGN